jgi:hypothetical protein
MWLISCNIQTVWSAFHFESLANVCNNLTVAPVAKAKIFIYPLSKKSCEQSDASLIESGEPDK